MNIVMMTNTYRPHVGGVANSVHAFAEAYRQRSHSVTVIAPEFENMPERESDIIRVPAIQNFNGSDFSISLPVTPMITRKVKALHPDLFHSHHPFLLGDTALRMATTLGKPLVFTYHTMYEHYTHYVPADSPTIRRFAKQLAAEYCNLCDHVIAPSESVRDLLRERGVETPVSVVPTGIDPDRFAGGDGAAFRAQWEIPRDRIVAGHVGRLAPEKNGIFLANALVGFIRANPERHGALIVGSGSSERDMRRIFEFAGVSDRALFAGKLTGRDLANAYRAMDFFAFASTTETQGMVLAEAMAAGNPVVALDAPGAREIVHDKKNGRLVMAQEIEPFQGALVWMAERPPDEMNGLREEARRTAKGVSIDHCADRALDVYESVLVRANGARVRKPDPWETIRKRLHQEWEIWSERFSALETAMTHEKDEKR